MKIYPGTRCSNLELISGFVIYDLSIFRISKCVSFGRCHRGGHELHEYVPYLPLVALRDGSEEVHIRDRH